MTGKKIMNNAETILDKDLYLQFDEAIKPIDLSSDKKEALRQRIFNRIDNEPEAPKNLMLTIRSHEGEWIEIAPKIKKKALFIDHEKGIESFLLKASAGAEIPAHVHEYDEYSMVLEGSVHFADMQFNAGDCQLARKGSYHGDCICPEGALVYQQISYAEHASL